MTAVNTLMLVMGMAVAALVGFYARPLGEKLGFLDFPDSEGGRKLHGKITPLVGGFGAIVTVLLAGTLMLVWPAEGMSTRTMSWFMVTVFGLFFVGALDDRVGLAARTRLAAASVILLAAVAQVPDFAVSFLLFTGSSELVLMQGALGIIFTLLCFVGLLNAVNMADGKNGVVIGQAIIWSLILFVRLPPSMEPMIAAVLGSLLVLFVFNMRGKLFLGDGGSYGLSALFGLLAIYAWNHGFADMRADDMALIFAIPVFDTIRLIFVRLANGKSPFTPGRDHLHHHLYSRWGWPRPLIWLLALVAIPNALAIMYPGTGLLWLIATLFGYLGMLWAATSEPRTHVA